MSVFAGQSSNPWSLYDEMIAGVPEDVLVTDYGVGTAWSYVEAECGMGVAWTARDGMPRREKGDLRGRTLRDLASLSKSWSFIEATLGVAALNAWYSHPERLAASGLRTQYESIRGEVAQPVGPEATDAAVQENERGPRLGMKLDAFEMMRPEIEARGDANVVVVGHFPRVTAIADYANLTVLERKCSDEWDTPDPACEYVMPEADYAFITGVTLINKTAPRLLTLAKDAHVTMVGPSVVMAPALFSWGADSLSGSVVSDPEAVRFGTRNGAGKLFGRALQMVITTRD